MRHLAACVVALWLVSTASGETLPDVVAWAQKELPRIQALPGYSATFSSIETVNGEPRRSIATVKVRHNPFAVYIGYSFPQGREAMYRAEAGNRFWIKEANRRVAFLSIDSQFVKKHSRYPITDFGVAKLTEKLIEVGQKEAMTPGIAVQKTRVMVESRVCIKYTIERPQFRVVIYVDEKLMIPVRYDGYQNERLLESYRYSNVQVMTFTDKDFDTRNSEYHFRR